MYTIDDVLRYSTWRHKATDKFYAVIGVARCATNGERDGKEQSVIYVHRHPPTGLYYRELSEFLDGRFEPVPVKP